MKKQMAALVAALLVLAALGGALFLALRQRDAPDGASPPDAGESIQLLSGGAEAVAAVEVENEKGGFTLQKSGGGFTVAGLEGLPLDQSKVDAAAGAAGSLAATREITEPAPLADYGLDKPKTRVTVQGADGAARALGIGNEAPSSKGRYLLLDGKVYLAESGAVAPFANGAEDFVSLQLTTALTAEEKAQTITLARAGEETITLEYQPGETVHVSSDASSAPERKAAYRMTAPVSREIKEYAVTGWSDAAFGLNASRVLQTRPDGDSLARLGLGEPLATLEIATTAGRRVKLTAFAPNADGSCAVLLDGVPAAFEVAAASLPWLETSLEAMIGSILPRLLPEELSELTVSGQGASYRFSPQGAGGGGTALSADAFARLAYAALDLASKRLAGGAEPRLDPALTIGLAFRDGERPPERVLLTPTGDGSLYVVTGDGCRFTTGEWKLQDILDACEEAAAPPEG